MTTAVLYALTTTALYYGATWARLTEFVWSRYPKWLSSFMECGACSGFYWGVILGLSGLGTGLPFLGLPANAWYTPIFVGLCAAVWTPILAKRLINDLLELQPRDDEAPQTTQPPKPNDHPL